MRFAEWLPQRKHNFFRAVNLTLLTAKSTAKLITIEAKEVNKNWHRSSNSDSIVLNLDVIFISSAYNKAQISM